MAIRTEADMASSGEFLREYGKTYCIAVTEALSIGRVKWEIFPIGNSGKDGLVYYLTTEKMRALCKEIASGLARKKLEADTAQYPGLYKYSTGEDARMHLNIGGGRYGARIQIQDTKANPMKMYMVAITSDALETMAFNFLQFTGLTYVYPGSYYQSLVDTFEAGREKRNAMHRNYDESMLKEQSQINDDNAPAESSGANSNSQMHEHASAQGGAEEVFTLTILGEKKDAGDKFWVFDTDGSDKVLFSKELVAGIRWFMKFEEKAKTEGVTFTIVGEKRKGYILFHDTLPAKK